MSIVLDGTSGITTPEIVSTGGPLVVNASAPDNSVVVNASGNVGIGTSSPSATRGPLTVLMPSNKNGAGIVVRAVNSGGAGAQPALTFERADGTVNYSIVSDQGTGFLAISDNTSERMRIDSSGNLLVGATSPAAKLTVHSNTASELTAAFTVLPADNSFKMAFMNGATGNTPGTSFGKLVGLFGNVEIASISMTRSGGAQAQDLRVVVGSAGVILNSGGTSWGSLSDERAKTDLSPIEDAVSKVMTLRSMTGRYVTDAEDKRRAFLIAQDVQAVLPEAVTEHEDEDKTLLLQYTEVIPLLVAAIKELKTINDAQAQTIESLTARVVALEQA